MMSSRSTVLQGINHYRQYDHPIGGNTSPVWAYKSSRTYVMLGFIKAAYNVIGFMKTAYSTYINLKAHEPCPTACNPMSTQTPDWSGSIEDWQFELLRILCSPLGL